MKIIRYFFALCDKVLGIFITLIAAATLLFSGYVLYDNFYKGKIAFSSIDLQQYKPTLKETKLGFTDILSLNPDTVAWLTIDGTHIDYPVLQGENDLEYINKDIYGKSSLTGSLYLRTQNSADFSDAYNLIYGHHMDNGAMFGDIDNFFDPGYFDRHRNGILMSPGQNFGVKVFAALKTDAYNDLIYFEDIDSAEKHDKLMKYITQNSEIYKDDTEHSNIIAFSTCTDSMTFGRAVIFASLTPIAASAISEEPEAPIKRVASGHYKNTRSLALINLLCVVFTFLTLFPLVFTANKYYQFVYAAEMSKKLSSDEPETAKDLRIFKIKIAAGTLVELLCFLLSVLIFSKTEYLRGNLAVMDKYTGIMIAVFGAALFADIIFFRYRGRHPEEKEEEFYSKS